MIKFLFVLAILGFFVQLNSSNEKNREAPLITQVSPSQISLDIDHSSKGDVTAVCDAKPDVKILDKNPDRPKKKTIYHNCELTYDLE